MTLITFTASLSICPFSEFDNGAIFNVSFRSIGMVLLRCPWLFRGLHPAEQSRTIEH